MKISIQSLLKGAVWTIGGFGVGQMLRLVSNIVLARLLAPELFGIMLIVNSLRNGIELISDVGIGQNVIYHQNANDPDFYNTAWTLQATRSVLLWLVALVIAAPVARFYQSPILVFVLPLTTFCIVLAGFTSISRSLLQKRMQLAKLNIFEIIMSVISLVAYLLLAYFSRTIWALVFGGIIASTATMIGSYFLLTDVKEKFHLSRRYTGEILHFGKWIFVSSIVYFLSANFDRLYLAKVVPLELLGVYGIARSIAELVSTTVMRLGNYVLFPFIALHAEMAREDLRKQLASIRTKSLLLAAVGCSLLVVTADLAVRILYDQRYHAATWMLPVMIIGAWFSILVNINEATLLGLGKPSYGAMGNTLKFAFLLIGLPLCVTIYGLLGGVIVVSLADLFRYIPILVGQRRERFAFGIQDLLITLTMFLLIGFWQWLRWVSGFGTSFESLPINSAAWFGAIR
jgi:O-antigen/teichoic acid export membrane protein